jgi:hypothetical protein
MIAGSSVWLCSLPATRLPKRTQPAPVVSTSAAGFLGHHGGHCGGRWDRAWRYSPPNRLGLTKPLAGARTPSFLGSGFMTSYCHGRSDTRCTDHSRDMNYLLLKAQRLAATKTEFVAFQKAA